MENVGIADIATQGFLGCVKHVFGLDGICTRSEYLVFLANMEYRNEKEVVNAVIHALNAAGNYVWRNNSGVVKIKQAKGYRMWRAGITGSSDVLGIAWDGKFIAVECKYGKNKPSEKQKQFLEAVENRGGYAIVAYSIEDLPEMLKNPPSGDW